jgi:hypothetical protein
MPHQQHLMPRQPPWPWTFGQQADADDAIENMQSELQREMPQEPLAASLSHSMTPIKNESRICSCALSCAERARSWGHQAQAAARSRRAAVCVCVCVCVCNKFIISCIIYYIIHHILYTLYIHRKNCFRSARCSSPRQRCGSSFQKVLYVVILFYFI